MAQASLAFSNVEPKLTSETLSAIQSFGFSQMTPVQSSTIPLFLSHKDVCVEATTGSGKTLAFGIPIFELLVKRTPPLSLHDVGAVILAPTRELATQIFEVLSKFSEFHKALKCMLLVGGTSVANDCLLFERNGANIVIGTPGRILDVRNKSQIMNFKALEILVLDEADTLLDMGFKESINQILSFLPKQRRTGLFSATQTNEVKELARAGLRNPVSIAVRVQNPTQTANSNNKQAVTKHQATPSTLSNWYMVCEYDNRIKQLTKFLLEHLNSKIIVFCATCACVDYYSNAFDQLTKQNTILPNTLSIVGLHGKMITKKRTGYYRKFVSLTSGVMFSTDVAARGIDVPDINWIIQLTAPKDPSFFVHRVGRTARAGKEGGALLFVTEEELPYIELLRGRGVPLIEKVIEEDDDNKDKTSHNDALEGDSLHKKKNKKKKNETDVNSNNSNINNSDNNANSYINVLEALKQLSIHDRDLLETSSTAFMSFLRAYKEHLCNYIFRLEQLDIGAVARSYALLRLPKIPETRGCKGKPIVFETTPIDTSTIPYKHKEKEEARQRRLQEYIKQKQEEEEEEEENNNNDNNNDSDDNSNNNTKSIRTTNTNKTNNTVKKQWIPAEEYQQLQQDNDSNEKRKRKKKESYIQKFHNEWDELAAEEMAFKKLKRGKISKEIYDNNFISEQKIELDSDTNEPILLGQNHSNKHKKNKNDSDSDIDDSNDEDDDLDSDNDKTENKKSSKSVQFDIKRSKFDNLLNKRKANSQHNNDDSVSRKQYKKTLQSLNNHSSKKVDYRNKKKFKLRKN